MDNNFSLLLEKHRDLDYLCRHPGDRIFVSDWYCQHPFVREYLPDDTFQIKEDRKLLYYCFQNDYFEIHEEIRKFHLANDRILYTNNEIFVGAGMTALLTAQMLMLISKGVKTLWYTKPLYYTFYYYARLFGIQLIPVNDIPLNRKGLELKLPRRNCWLIVCDPIWFMGREIEDEYIEQIADWQKQTASHIIVDGAFQYMKWDTKERFEPTSRFDKELTFRFICPTKSLAVHGVRFSYILLPEKYQDDIRYAYANSSGSSCILSNQAALKIMEVLNSPESNFKLLQYIRGKYDHFLNHDIFIDDIGAKLTYFIFVKLKGSNSKYIVMDQDFFDTTNYPEYIRFNLLLPHQL